MSRPPIHQPVLLSEILRILDPRPGQQFLDCTMGYGGHSAVLLDHIGRTGFLWGLDQDPEALQGAEATLRQVGDNFQLVHGNFGDLAALASTYGWGELDGILIDLGVSSPQLDRPARGFGFQAQGPLDMRMDPRLAVSAADLINRLSERELANLIAAYGEDPAARRIARAIVRRRPLQTTSELAALIANVRPRRSGDRTHPATRTFQALRIAVNRELEAVAAVIPAAVTCLRPGGALVMIAYQSLEDRLVKQAFRREAMACLCPPRLPACRCGHRPTVRLLTRRAIRPQDEEIRANARARSARLRAVARIETET